VKQRGELGRTATPLSAKRNRLVALNVDYGKGTIASTTLPGGAVRQDVIDRRLLLRVAHSSTVRKTVRNTRPSATPYLDLRFRQKLRKIPARSADLLRIVKPMLDLGPKDIEPLMRWCDCACSLARATITAAAKIKANRFWKVELAG